MNFFVIIGDFLTSPHHSITDVVEGKRAKLLSSLSFALTFFLFAGLITSFLRSQNMASALTTFGVAFIVSLTGYLLSRTKYTSVGAFLFIVGFCTSAYVNIILDHREVRATLLFYIPIGLIISNAILPPAATFLITGLNVAATIMLPLFGVQLPENYGGALGIITVISITLILLRNYQSGIEKSRTEEIEKANLRLQQAGSELESNIKERTLELEKVSQDAMVRAAQLQAITEISQAIVLEQDTHKLLPLITRLISEKFGYYHAGIFIINNDGYAELRAANSEGGRQMLERGHKLRIGATGLVGYVAQQGVPRIALDVDADAAYFHNPDLPNTRSEVALPLKIGTKVIGILDVQSTQASAFGNDDVEILSTLANQVATAIQNAQLFEKLQETLNSYLQGTSQDWKRIAKQKGKSGLLYKSDGTLAELESIETDPQKLFSTRDAIIETKKISVPVRVRDQIIGVINIDADDTNREWNDSEISLIQTVSERAAFAMENARLFEEASRRAQQERLLTEISANISMSTDFERIMQTTIEELGRALGATRTFIQLRTVDDQENIHQGE